MAQLLLVGGICLYKCNIYIDGTWLFRQCAPNSIMAQQTYNENEAFKIDFNKLINAVIDILQTDSKQNIIKGSLWYYTSIIRNIPDYDSNGKNLDWLKQLSVAKDKTVENARKAGFNTAGVFDIPFKPWIPQRIMDKTYQEKMVDTSLVARMVLECLNNPEDFHVLISGDLDMLPVLDLIVPSYIEKIVLFTTHPDQWDPNQQQTSKKLNDFHFNYGPYYLEKIADRIMQGSYILVCEKCKKLFANSNKPPAGKNTFCPVHRNIRPKRNLY